MVCPPGLVSQRAVKAYLPARRAPRDAKPRATPIHVEPARRHAYTLSGIRPPLSLLARAGHADWTFAADGDATDVTGRYRFELSHWIAWPLASVLLQVFMRTAMRRCLHAMDAHLAATRG